MVLIVLAVHKGLVVVDKSLSDTHWSYYCCWTCLSTLPWPCFYLALSSPWPCHELALTLSWTCFDIAMTLPWPSPYSWPLELFLRIWFRVPRVRGGDCSGAAHGKLHGYFSIHNQSLVSISSKYNIYALLLSNEWCLNLLIHLEGLIVEVSCTFMV